MASSKTLSKQNPDASVMLTGPTCLSDRTEVINALIVNDIVVQMLADDCDQGRRRHQDVL